MDESSILVRQDGSVAIARIVGKGSFKNARLLKSYAESTIKSGATQLVFDLQKCQHLDSTFMGVLAGISSEQKKIGNFPPKIVHANARNMELLGSLGLNRIMEIDTVSNTNINATDCVPLQATGESSKDDVAQTMLEAHQQLIDADSRNATKFQDVIAFLKNKLEADGK